jgi:hypothetical protein
MFVAKTRHGSRWQPVTAASIHYSVVFTDAGARPTTHTFNQPARKGQKSAETRFGSHNFKPIVAEGRSAAKVACDYTRWPEVAYATPHGLPSRARGTEETRPYSEQLTQVVREGGVTPAADSIVSCNAIGLTGAWSPPHA